MPTGSCVCGAIKVNYTGEPEMVALCHCTDCKKTSGSTHSYNHVVPSQRFEVTSGKPKEISKTGDSGGSMTSCFCPDCGTTLFRYGDAFGGVDGMRIVKAGILDDVSEINSHKPGVELYVKGRVEWNPPTGGQEKQTME